MFVSWILFPLLLTVLCLGCGLLLEGAAGRRLPGTLLAPAGFAVIVVLAGLLTARGETASLASPAVVVAALAGAALAFRARRVATPDGWIVAAAIAVFALYAAPIVLSGEPTFAGYIKLDDTATWMAFVDRVMDHGRDLSGLEPSSYLSTLSVNLPSGYPVGAFLPLGVGVQLTGTDVAWLVQPYMATMAALLASALYWLARPLVESRPLRALAAFGAAQSALLFGYALWGGLKEVALALVLATLAALAPFAARRDWGWRGVLPAAFATAAFLALLGTRGAVFALPILALVAAGLWRADGLRALLSRSWPLLLFVLVLGAPALFAAGAFAPAEGSIDDAAELGNLVGPLDLFQYVGIWPTGDFRLDPINEPLTVFLLALALAAAAVGAWIGVRRRAWDPLVYAVGTGIGCLFIFALTAPWVGAKALASGSPSLLLLALAGAAVFAARVEKVLGTTVLALLIGGVLWSTALAYHDVWLAPYEQLRELEEINEEFAGEGPTLMTEYQPYGVRHFLRDADAEGASELRVRPVALVEGGEAEKGAWVDTDQIVSSSLLTYRTLVLRRSPGQSRPPAVYLRVRHGDYYDVWQRPADAAVASAERLPLGDLYEPAAVPSCAQVLALGELVGPEGTLAAVERRPNLIGSLSEGRYSRDWLPTEPGSLNLTPYGSGAVGLRVEVSSPGRYDLFVQGSVRNPLTMLVDGEEVGSVDYQLNGANQFLHLGRIPLTAGSHDVVLALAGQSLAPGSGGPPEAIGPLVLSPALAEDPPVRELPAARAREFCGRNLDWIEALP